MKILIIGKNGFVAKNLSEYLRDKNEDLTVVSSSELNLLDEHAVRQYLSANYFDVIIDTAVYNPGTASTDNSGLTREKEVEYDLRMFHNVAKCHEMYGRLIYFGSGAEYDKSKPICSVTEEYLDDADQCTIPGNMYGLAKYIIGREIESGIYGAKNIYCLKIFGLFGKYENWKTTFISGACCKAMKGFPITIRQNVYFDYLYIDDFCRMIHKFIELESPKYHSYNITSGRRVSLTELADIVKNVSGKDVPVIVCKDGLANEYTASNKRLLDEIGEISFISYNESIEALYKWYCDNSESIDSISLLYQ